MVRKSQPEPGADSGLPQAVSFTQKGKEKKPQHSDSIKCFDFCFEALVLRHSTKQRHGGEKKSSYLQATETIFPLKLLSHRIMKF